MAQPTVPQPVFQSGSGHLHRRALAILIQRKLEEKKKGMMRLHVACALLTNTRRQTPCGRLASARDEIDGHETA
jgi:hypothetical protein